MANLIAFPNFLAPATPFEHGLVMFADLLFFIHYLANKAAGARTSFMAEIDRLIYRSDPRIIEYISGMSGFFLEPSWFSGTIWAMRLWGDLWFNSSCATGRGSRLGPSSRCIWRATGLRWCSILFPRLVTPRPAS